MVNEDPEGVSQLVVRAARAAGVRVILSRGWAGFAANDRDCLVANDIPHSKLFPQMAVVVHHGGSGTTALAARCGAPQVIVPHMTDQFYWAHRIPKLGLGPPSIWRSRLTEKRLTEALRACLMNAEFRTRAREIASALSQTDPVGETVRAICSAVR
jgi:UDP:flavonoid glycosyltransferase YjiC (YdhE family)